MVRMIRIFNVRMTRKVKNEKRIHLQHVLVEAQNETDALTVAKEVHRGYSVDTVTVSPMDVWRRMR